MVLTFIAGHGDVSKADLVQQLEATAQATMVVGSNCEIDGQFMLPFH